MLINMTLMSLCDDNYDNDDAAHDKKSSDGYEKNDSDDDDEHDTGDDSDDHDADVDYDDDKDYDGCDETALAMVADGHMELIGKNNIRWGRQ